MSSGNALIQDQELDFLLLQANGGHQGEEDLEGLENQTEHITIRGDLDKISLSDIFQTLSMSKMEGILRVHRPLENRLIHFDEEGVRLLAVNRDENRRLGQRLVQSGLITSANLRSALLEQKQRKVPLGEALVSNGVITEERLETTLMHQQEEDLYGLFTWDTGSFEFYKGVEKDSELAKTIGESPSLVINGVLLEVARRADEWRQILKVIRSVDEVPCFLDDGELPEMCNDSLVVCETIDESSTIGELSDMTMLGLFSCAKAVCTLMHEDILVLSSAESMLELAREAAHKGNHKRALILCRTIQHRKHEIEFELCESMAEILKTCREPKMGAQLLVSCAEFLRDRESKLKIARLAFEMDSRTCEVQLLLREQLELADLGSEPLFAEVTNQLCSTLSDQGDFEVALKFHKELEELQPEDATLMTRKARLLQATGRNDEALEVLNEARELIEPTGNKNRIQKLYEQILKLDPGAREVQKALRELRGGKARMRRLRLIALLVIVVVAGLSWMGWSWYDHKERFDAVVSAIRSKLSKRDTDGARRLLNTAQLDLGEGEKWDPLRKEFANITAAIKTGRTKAEIAKVQKALDQAGDLAKAGKVAEAVQIYRAQLDRKTRHRGVHELIKKCAIGHFTTTLKTLEALSEELQKDMPGPAGTLGKLKSFRAAASLLKVKIGIDRQLVNGVITLSKDQTLIELIKAENLERMIDIAKEINATTALAAEHLTAYVLQIARLEKNQRLDPVFAAARRAERVFDFRSAERLYHQLFDEYRGHATHAPVFQDRVAKYAAINKSLAMLIESTKNGDFLDARAHYRHLKASYRDYPWAKMIQLPVRVITIPTQSIVSINGKVIGESPLFLPFVPGIKNRLEIQRKGFLQEQTILEGDEIGLVRSTLTLAPLWKMKTKGAVEKAPVGSDNRIFMVDRSGIAVAWSANEKQELWSNDIGDLSGLLTRPILFDDQILIGSLDGPLRALDASTGRILWTLPNLPTESTPCRIGEVLVLATTDRRLVVVDIEKRAVRWSTDLGTKSLLDVCAIDDYALLALEDGTMRAISVEDKTDRWPTIKLDPGALVQHLVQGDRIIVCTDEGHLSVYNASSGKRTWHRTRLGELRWRPATKGSRLFVTAPSTIDEPAQVLSFNLVTGRPGPVFRPPEGTTWSCPPSCMQGSVLVGTRDGTLMVLDEKMLQVQFVIRGKGAVCARPISLVSRKVICSFDGKELLVLPRLR